MNILFLLRDEFYEANPKVIEDAKQLGANVHVLYTASLQKEELFTHVANVDIIVTAVVKIDREVIDRAPKLKYIIKFGAGYDNIDVAYARSKGILVSNAPGQNAKSVADLAFALMLSAARNLPQKDREVKSDHWELSIGNEVFGKRLGLIGFGSIGQAIAKRASGFEMDTIAYGNYKNYEAAEKWNVRFVDLPELLTTSDFVVICTSLTEKNRKMINRQTLELMKQSAILINISRGGLIDEDDLIGALKEKRIKGAALDVFASEPPKNELAKLPNVIATPHIGGATYEAIDNIGKITISNIRKFMAKQKVDYIVRL
jgi:D-3-phosphoglycerate dehydrogenase